MSFLPLKTNQRTPHPLWRPQGRHWYLLRWQRYPNQKRKNQNLRRKNHRKTFLLKTSRRPTVVVPLPLAVHQDHRVVEADPLEAVALQAPQEEAVVHRVVEVPVAVAPVAPHQTTTPLQEEAEAGATLLEEVQETELPHNQRRTTD